MLGNVLVLGNAASGKSTLIQVLRSGMIAQGFKPRLYELHSDYFVDVQDSGTRISKEKFAALLEATHGSNKRVIVEDATFAADPFFAPNVHNLSCASFDLVVRCVRP